MRHRRVGLLALTIVFFSTARAGASPITLIAQGFDGREQVSDAGRLPTDLSDGYAQIVHEEFLHPNRTPGTNWYSGIDSDFQIRLYFSPSGSSVPLGDQPSLLVEGHVSGGFFAGSSSNINAGFSGLGKITHIYNWTPDAGIAQGVLDQILKMSDFFVSYDVSGGTSNEFSVTLFAQSPAPGAPAPTPEPTTLALFGTILIVMSVAGRLRDRRR